MGHAGRHLAQSRQFRGLDNLRFGRLARRDVLADADHADDFAIRIAPGGGAQQHVHMLGISGQKRAFEVADLLAPEGGLKNLSYGLFVFGQNEFIDKVAVHDFVLAVAGNLSRHLVPLVDFALDVDAEDRRVGGVDQLCQFDGDPLLLLMGLVQFGNVCEDRMGYQDAMIILSAHDASFDI